MLHVVDPMKVTCCGYLHMLATSLHLFLLQVITAAMWRENSAAMCTLMQLQEMAKETFMHSDVSFQHVLYVI